MDMGTGSVTLGVIFFASRLGASPLTIGVMASAYRLLYVFFCQVFGRLSDRVGYKKLTQTACFLFIILHLLVPFCGKLYQLVIFFPLTGIVLAAFWPAMEAWIGHLNDGRPLLKRVGIFNLFWTAGLMIGYLGGGCLGYIGDVQTRVLFYFASFAALCAAIAITIQPKVSVEHRAKSEEEEVPSSTPHAPSSTLLALRSTLL